MMMPPTYVLHSHGADDSEKLIFGLTWRVVIGPRPEKESASILRAERASHAVPVNERSTVVGFVTLTGAKKARGERVPTLYSAAMLFAESYQKGVHALIADLGEGRHWFVASHDGEVVAGTDRVFDSLEEAQSAFEALGEQYSDVLRADHSGLQRKSIAAKLVEVKGTITALPLWMRVSAVVLLAVVALDYGADLWGQYAKHHRKAKFSEVSVDAVALWKQALDDWQKTVPVDGAEGFHRLLSSVGQIPLKPGGWKLFTVECVPDRAGWICSAIYRRGASGTNTSLSSALPHGWTVAWIDLEKARVSWAELAKRNSLDRMQLDSAERQSLEYTSFLQSVTAAFKAIQFPPRTTVVVAAPTYLDGAGEKVAVPNPSSAPLGARIPGVRKVVFYGPLRSMTVLPITQNTTIKSLKLKIGDYMEPSISNSSLTAEVSGDMYVQ